MIYFYPIIFIGAFFLLNLTLAVIKAKFTEEMNNKNSSKQDPDHPSSAGAAQGKRKKLDDALPSSEDEDMKARLVKEKLDKIERANNMSPRTKDIERNKIRIEHMLWRVDTVFQRKDA